MPDKVRDRRDRPWSWFDDEVIKLYGRDLGPYGIAVYMALLTFADSKNRTCFPSMQQLAEMTGMSRRQVINSIKKLEGLKLIRKSIRHDVGKEYASNLYTILTPYGSEYHSLPSELDASGSEYGALPSEYHAPEVVNTVHRGGEYGAHELDVLNQTHIEPEKEDPPVTPNGVTSPQGDDVTPEPTKSPRAKRIPNDWQPTEQDLAWAHAKGYDTLLDLILETEEFCTFWASQGKGASKLDWSGTWKVRMIEQARKANQHRTRASPSPPDAHGCVGIPRRDEEKRYCPVHRQTHFPPQG